MENEIRAYVYPMRVVIEVVTGGNKTHWFMSDGSYKDLVNMSNGINCFTFFYYNYHKKIRILARINGKYVIKKAISSKVTKKSKFTDEQISAIVGVFQRNLNV